MAAEVMVVCNACAMHLANDVAEVLTSDLCKQSRRSRSCKDLDDHFEAVKQLIAVAIDGSDVVDVEDALGILRVAMSWSSAGCAHEISTATVRASDSGNGSEATQREMPPPQPQVPVSMTGPVAAPTSTPLAIKDEFPDPDPRHVAEAAAAVVGQGVIEIEDDEGDRGDKGEQPVPAPERPNDLAVTGSIAHANYPTCW